MERAAAEAMYIGGYHIVPVKEARLTISYCANSLLLSNTPNLCDT
jgi:hypothetical protein